MFSKLDSFENLPSKVVYVKKLTRVGVARQVLCAVCFCQIIHVFSQETPTVAQR
jgi:hypothetical protein